MQTVEAIWVVRWRGRVVSRMAMVSQVGIWWNGGAIVGLIVLAMLGRSVASASAETVDLEKFQRQLELIQRENRIAIDPNVPVSQRVLVEYGGFLSFAFLMIEDSAQVNHTLRQTDLNAYGRVNFDDVHEFFFRGRSTYRDFNAQDSFNGLDNDLIEPTLDRGYYRFDAARAVRVNEGRDPGGVFHVTAGRQLVVWGNGLTLSQVVDGGAVTFGRGNVTADLLAASSRKSNADIDSSRPGFDGDMDRNFVGLKLNYKVNPNTKLYVYGLWQNDDNDITATVLGVSTMFDYQSNYIGAGIEGAAGDRWLYGVEIVVEGGNTYSTSVSSPGGVAVSQTRDDIQAWAIDGRVDYLWLDQARTRFTVEVVLASGDEDRAFSTSNTYGGNASGTRDRAFNGFGLLNTGLAFAPKVSNLAMMRVGASSYPFRGRGVLDKLQVGANAFVFNKFRKAGPISETTSGNRFLGAEIDLFFNWQLTSDLSWSTRYGVFFPGEAITASHDSRHFLYTGITLAF